MAATRAVPRAARRGVLGYFTTHPTAANLLLVLMVAAGLFAALNMRAQTLPDIVTDDIEITVDWDGADPAAVDAAVIGRLLPALRGIDGIEETEATAREGRARIDAEFEPGWDMARALGDVESAVLAVRDLPEDAERPVVALRSWRDRVVDVVISGPVGSPQLARFADGFLDELLAAGVVRTRVDGVAAPETRVTVATRDLIRHDLTLAEIAAAIAAAAESEPAGALDSAGARFTAGAERRGAQAVAEIVLRGGAGGEVLRVGDVAEVSASAVDRAQAFYTGALPAMVIRVERDAEGDAIEIQKRVAALAETFARDLPPEVEITLIRSRADRITERLAILLDNGLVGLGLVLALLFLFLNARTALWVAAGIPVAMLGSVAMMHAAGVSLNLVSLFGLIITLGIVVDDAIVVGEHADFRARHLGEPPALAAANAARRMALPVLTATVTTVIAFFALTGIGGRFGTLIIDIPITVIAVLAASLVECFLILPAHMRHALSDAGRARWYDGPSRVVNHGLGWLRERAVRPLIRAVLAARYPVIAGAIAALAGQVALLISQEVPWRFWNAPERGSVTVSFAMLDGAERQATLEQLAEVQRAVDAAGARLSARHGGPHPVAHVLGEIGGPPGRGLDVAEGKDSDLVGAVQVDLISADLRPYSSFQVIDALREEIVPHPQLEEISYFRWRSGPGGESLSVDLTGEDPGRLKSASEAIQHALAVYPAIATLQDTMPRDKRRLVLTATPQAQALGVTEGAIGAVLRDRLTGIEAARFAAGPRTASIRVDLPDSEKTADFLRGTLIRTPGGAFVPLADLVEVAEEPGFAVIRRVNGAAALTVTGDLDLEAPDRAAVIQEALATEILPRIAAEHGVSWQLSGLAAQERSFLADAGTAFALCLLGIYLALAWVFASWSRPLAIMAIIPFGLTGAIWGHDLWGVPMSMFSVVGLIGLTGILINDSIVLISTADELARRRGLFPAIEEAVCNRLRPVLLTTLTTVLGLTPLLYETSQQAQFLKPTVITLVFGMGVGFLLVLVLVPALLAAGHDAGRAARALRRAGRGSARGTRGAVGAAALAIGLWALPTIGPVVTGGPAILPGLAPASAAMAAFLAGSAAICLAAWALTAAALSARRRRA